MLRGCLYEAQVELPATQSIGEDDLVVAARHGDQQTQLETDPPLVVAGGDGGLLPTPAPDLAAIALAVMAAAGALVVARRRRNP